MSFVSHNLQEQAKKLAAIAVKYDKAGNKEKAFTYYFKAAELLLKLAEYTKIKKLKARYLEYANKYINRCYELKGIKEESLKIGETPTTFPMEKVKKSTKMSDDEKAIFEAISDLVIHEKPNVKMSDVANLENAKEAIKEAVILPTIRPDIFKGSRKPWKGILLFGPPGCGKTHLARAIANEINANFLNVDAASIFVKWVGESEKRIKALFKFARMIQPSIIFIDEIDAMGTSRERESESGVEHRIKTQFLTEVDGVLSDANEKVTVLAATNIPWAIDPALRRRFEKRIYIPPPDFHARKRIFEINLRNIDLDDDVDIDELAKITELYTGADITLVCREAAMIPIREISLDELKDPNFKPRPIKMADFEIALEKIKPSISVKDIIQYEKWAQQFENR